MHDEVMGRTGIWNAQTLSAYCDLDLCGLATYVLARNILCCHDDHFCQIIFKYDHA